ncbi:hypothetical protein SRHO_G00012330 [Serrasalmus rhombeus]
MKTGTSLSLLLEFLCGLWVQLPSRIKTTEEPGGLFICGPESKLVGDDASQSAVGRPSAGSSVGQLKSYFEELEEKLRVKTSLRMAFQCLSWISILLCIAQVSSMPTKCQLQQTLMAKTHNLLETMTGPVPLQCLDDIPVEIRSPTWALQSKNSKQDVGAAKAVYKSLMKVSSLMESDSFPQSWDADKLVKFQIIVDRQIEESECITRIKTQKEEDDFAVRDAALTDYFDKLEKLLKEKEFSVCAWEVVRREVLSVLQFILVENSNNFWLTV